MINAILSKFGLKIVDINEIFPDITNSNPFDKDKFEEVKSVIRLNPVVREYLDWIIAQDIKRYFVAGVDEQPMIRGAVSRTKYLYSLGEEQAKRLTQTSSVI